MPGSFEGRCVTGLSAQSSEERNPWGDRHPPRRLVTGLQEAFLRITKTTSWRVLLGVCRLEAKSEKIVLGNLLHLVPHSGASNETKPGNMKLPLPSASSEAPPLIVNLLDARTRKLRISIYCGGLALRICQ